MSGFGFGPGLGLGLLSVRTYQNAAPFHDLRWMKRLPRSPRTVCRVSWHGSIRDARLRAISTTHSSSTKNTKSSSSTRFVEHTLAPRCFAGRPAAGGSQLEPTSSPHRCWIRLLSRAPDVFSMLARVGARRAPRSSAFPADVRRVQGDLPARDRGSLTGPRAAEERVAPQTDRTHARSLAPDSFAHGRNGRAPCGACVLLPDGFTRCVNRASADLRRRIPVGDLDDVRIGPAGGRRSWVSLPCDLTRPVDRTRRIPIVISNELSVEWSRKAEAE